MVQPLDTVTGMVQDSNCLRRLICCEKRYKVVTAVS